MSNTSDIKKRLIASLMQFLTEELSSEELSPDSKDSIEVAIQCLETAYEINPVDGTLPSKKPILEIFSSYLPLEGNNETKKAISEEDKQKANELKNLGNDFMKAGKFQEAIETYTKAIQLDDTNPIYYSNRAAAHSKMNNHEAAIEDCKIAIKHDPTYSKAYCRMGLAYVSLNDHQRGRDAYKKAVELDPSESNKANLQLAEQKLSEQQMQDGGLGGLGGLGNIFRNPQFMTMANQIMTDPNMQNMFAKIFSSAQGAAGEAGQSNDSTADPSSNPFLQMGQQFMGQMGAANPEQSNSSDATTGGGSMDSNPLNAFLQVGQQFAEQMRAANPELIEQLKKAAQGKVDGNDPEKKPEN